MDGVQSHNHVKPNSVEVVLRLSWGCDNNFETKVKSNSGSKYYMLSEIFLRVKSFMTGIRQSQLKLKL